MDESNSQNLLKNPIGQNRLSANCLSEKQSAAIEMLAMGKSFQCVADGLAVDRRTIYAWRQDEDFQLALADRRRELWSSAADRLRGMLDSSLSVIEQRLHDRYERSRFQAATACLR